MNQTASQGASEVQRFLDRLSERSARRSGEPTWIAARRQAGAARFEAMGFPDRRVEEWKYTDVRAISRGDFQLAEDAEFSPASAAALTLPMDAHRLTFVDGVFSSALSDLTELPGGVQVQPLSQALEENHEKEGRKKK